MVKVNIFRMNNGIPDTVVNFTHEFMFKASAEKWADGFNRIHQNDPEESFIAVVEENLVI